jgi:16S rRNA (adenine1518-N6/adenine1519-N6)-dimethyltransferase
MYTLKKSLGQHFLRDENIARKIVAAVEEMMAATGGGRLLEVGPGGGALTKFLLEIPGTKGMENDRGRTIDFKAVELDDEKIRYLLKNWPALEGKIVHASILDIEKPWDERFTVVGNFPYNISSQILFRMLDWRESLNGVVGMFQKEMAQRVAAREGNKVYGVLSVLVQAFFTVEYLFDVHEQCFNPPPKVKSGVIRLIPRTQLPNFKNQDLFFQLVKMAFNQRRKTLRNAVKPLFGAAELADPVFDRRAEQLSIDEFAALTWKRGHEGKKTNTPE